MSKEISKKANRMYTHIINKIQGYSLEDPIKSREIENALGVSGVVVREAVWHARAVEHLPICANVKGYFYPRNKVEATRTIKSLYSRANEIKAAATGIEKFFTDAPQQRLL
tara:strand:- start:362 stop:694 length:333 start_codon:yes stop_codon:yes gene_type:complete